MTAEFDNVFIVEEWVSYEGNTVMAVFHKEEDAIKHKEQLTREAKIVNDNGYMGYAVIEWKVL